jgi:hypothetical protein
MRFFLAWAVTLSLASFGQAQPLSFEKDIRPILNQKCGACHGADPQKGQLDLRTVSELLRGGENGPTIVPGKPEASLLVDILERGQMPPGKKDKLTPAELKLVREWVKAGAPSAEKLVALPPRGQVSDKDREHWAFQPPKQVPVPTVNARDRVRSPIDAFLLARLEAKKLSFSAEADRPTLIRRVYFDLVGLPPSPDAVTAFVTDKREDAYERLVDELLKSPHYGERWGRHWLDAAGYVDGKLDNDLGSIYPNTGIWRYRDYVVRALNEDKPFDQFLTEQLAGDELVDWRNARTFDARTISLLTATGFLRNVDDHTDFPQYGVEKRYEVINETLDMFSTAVLGLTMECCRCHNHKYDPLPQRDFYRLMACFEAAFNVKSWKQPKDRYLADVSPTERAAIDRRNAEIDQQVAELLKSDAATRRQVRQRVSDSRLQSVPEVIRLDVKTAVNLQPTQRNEVQKYLAEKFQSVVQIADAAIDAALTDSEKAALRTIADQTAAFAKEKKSYGVVQALWDVGPAPASHVHRRGNVHALGVLVQPGFPEILQPKGTSSSASAVDVKGESSGRRLALARWLTRPDHPLTARVFVNRVWHHHFGRGIVETLGNFGRSGSPATHPELLDWLALDFAKNGWSTKRLHRQILLSSAYRQSSRRIPESAAEQADPDNRLLWRMNLRRLDAEIVRDAILAASGQLDRTAGGPPVEITLPANGLSEAKPAPTPASANRRSLYLFARRVYLLKFLEIFDAPIMPVNCTQRTNSANVLQSLAVLNSEFVVGQAGHLADEIVREAGEQPAARVRLAYQRALNRSPRDAEAATCVAFLRDQANTYVNDNVPPQKAGRDALADLCQMLIASNEFLYVE